MKNGDSGKSVTFKGLVIFLVMVIVSLITLGVNHTVGAIDKVDKKVEELEKTKVDKDRYKTDQGRLEQALKDINSKLDRISDRI